MKGATSILESITIGWWRMKWVSSDSLVSLLFSSLLLSFVRCSTAREMDFAKSQFEAAFASKRPLTKQGLSSLIDGVDSTQLSTLYRWLFHRLNDQLLHLARHNQAGDLFLSARQVSFQLHEHFIGKFSSSPSSPIKQLGQTLKSLQQQPTLTQSELNQWKRSQQGLRRDDFILHCLFNNSPQLALTNDTSIFLGDLFRVALHTCVQNLADRDNKTSLKILLSLGLAPLDIIQRIMSTTVYHDLRTFCAQYLNDFGEEILLDQSRDEYPGFSQSTETCLHYWNSRGVNGK